MKYFVVFIVSFFVLSSAFAQKELLSRYFVPKPTDAQMQQVGDLFEVTSRRADGFEVIVPAERAAELLKIVPAATVLEKDIHEIFDTRGRIPGWFAGYHNFQSVQDEMDALQAKYPNLVQVQTYGNSIQGRPLKVLKLSGNVHLDEEEPEILITAATHGDEIITVEIVLGLLNNLLKSYGEDARLTSFIESKEIYFIPVVNPDGYVHRERYDNGRDPNREYAYPENPSKVPYGSIKPLVDFFHSRHFSGTMDFHASGRLIMYPWAYTYAPVESFFEKLFNQLTGAMAQSNNYTYGQISKVIYVAKGSSADYYFWKNNSASLGIEVGTDKAPATGEIDHYIRENTESTWKFIEHF